MGLKTSSKCTGLWFSLTGSGLVNKMFFFSSNISLRIDESSPLWSVAPVDLRTEHFEIILTLEGIVPETGNNIQVNFLDL